MAAHLTSEGPLRDYKLPDYRYYPTELLPNGTRDWARVLLLQACERLKIPDDRWPKFSERLDLPAPFWPTGFKFAPFSPPAYEELQESSGEWRQRAEEAFRQYCDHHVQMIDTRLKKEMESGVLTKITKPKEKTSSIELRYEWAARRYCFNEPYKDMATDEHSPEKIRKTVSTILSNAKVPRRK